ncbi:hypothetical protein DMENIID0001_062480 [Sergentomyia squamirostris]
MLPNIRVKVIFLHRVGERERDFLEKRSRQYTDAEEIVRGVCHRTTTVDLTRNIDEDCVSRVLLLLVKISIGLLAIFTNISPKNFFFAIASGKTKRIQCTRRVNLLPSGVQEWWTIN